MPTAPARSVLHLTGSLTLRNADSVLAQLRDGLDGADGLTIDLAAVTEIDISFLQMLIAAKKTAAETGKPMAVVPSDHPLLAQEAARCGLPMAALAAAA